MYQAFSFAFCSLLLLGTEVLYTEKVQEWNSVLAVVLHAADRMKSFSSFLLSLLLHFPPVFCVCFINVLCFLRIASFAL